MLEIHSTSPELRSYRPWGWHKAQNRSVSNAGLRRLGCFLQKKILLKQFETKKYRNNNFFQFFTSTSATYTSELAQKGCITRIACTVGI